MVDFIKRNLPVFIIGGITVVFFLIVIALSQRDEGDSLLPSLIRVEQPDRTDQPQTPPTPTQEVSSDFRNMTPQQIEQAIKQRSVGQGQYNQSVSLLPGNPIDSAVQSQFDWYNERTQMTDEEINSEFGQLTITFTEQGFDPRDAKGYVNQTVVFRNNTSNTIELKQNTPKYEEWETNKRLGPGERLEFKLTQAGTWRYSEVNSRLVGSVFAKVANKYVPEAPTETPATGDNEQEQEE